LQCGDRLPQYVQQLHGLALHLELV
jgi:hypothetical protein